MHLPRPPLQLRPSTASEWREHRAIKKASRTGPILNQPTLDDPATTWQAWYGVDSRRIPVWMLRDNTGTPMLISVEYNILARNLIPRDTPTNERGHWITMTNWLFAVPGLYRHIVESGPYPVGSSFRPAPYPSDVGSASIFLMASWYAARGVTFEAAQAYQALAHRSRNERAGRSLEDHSLFTDGGPNTIADVGMVPSLHELGPIAPGAPLLPPNPPANAMAVDLPPPAVENNTPTPCYALRSNSKSKPWVNPQTPDLPYPP